MVMRAETALEEVLLLLLILATVLDPTSSSPSMPAAQERQRPPNAKNITVYGLRPYNLTGDLVNKDTADANGDVFWWSKS